MIRTYDVTQLTGTCVRNGTATDPARDLLMLEDQELTTSLVHCSDDGNSNDDIISIGNNQYHLISCEEIAIEPGFSVSLPLMFLETFRDSIGLASSAWIEVTSHLFLYSRAASCYCFLLFTINFLAISVLGWNKKGKGSSSQWTMQ